MLLLAIFIRCNCHRGGHFSHSAARIWHFCSFPGGRYCSCIVTSAASLTVVPWWCEHPIRHKGTAQWEPQLKEKFTLKGKFTQWRWKIWWCFATFFKSIWDLRASRDWDHSRWAVWSHCVLCFVFYILKQVPICFSRLEERCNTVLLWNSSNVFVITKLYPTPCRHKSR